MIVFKAMVNLLAILIGMIFTIFSPLTQTQTLSGLYYIEHFIYNGPIAEVKDNTISTNCEELEGFYSGQVSRAVWMRKEKVVLHPKDLTVCGRKVNTIEVRPVIKSSKVSGIIIQALQNNQIQR